MSLLIKKLNRKDYEKRMYHNIKVKYIDWQGHLRLHASKKVYGTCHLKQLVAPSLPFVSVWAAVTEHH